MSSSKFLIYTSISSDEDLDFFHRSFIPSLLKYGHFDVNIMKLVILTTDEFKNQINISSEVIEFDYLLVDNNLTTKYKIYNYQQIDDYAKILYITPDILIINNLIHLFNFDLKDKIYVLEEGVINDDNEEHDYYGGYILWSQSDKDIIFDITGISNRILLFNNSEKNKYFMSRMVEVIESHMKYWVHWPSPLAFPIFGDRQFLHHRGRKFHMLNNKKLKTLVLSSDKLDSYNGEILKHHGKSYEKTKIEDNLIYLDYLNTIDIALFSGIYPNGNIGYDEIPNINVVYFADPEHNVNVTNICLSSLVKNNILEIPQNGMIKDRLFSDPKYGSQKSVIITINKITKVYHQHEYIRIYHEDYDISI